MTSRLHNSIFFTLICLFSLFTNSYAQSDLEQRHIKVALRMIGHEVLLSSGDSISRVLAIEKEADRFKIHFESSFHFYPEDIVETIKRITTDSKLTRNYIVEIEKCGTDEVVYSYEVGDFVKTELIPCRGRKLPRDCYELYMTILDPGNLIYLTSFADDPNGLLAEEKESTFKFVWLTLPLIILLALFYFYGKKKNDDYIDPDIITIGAYLFDKRNMTLSYEKNKTELTSKEADLLFLLYTSANATIEREHMLKVVWGDEGDYVGRTLDVFISKLRKKLAEDGNLKIVNIRGVGYKFVINSQEAMS